jgi:preprotein translocase subunit SecG
LGIIGTIFLVIFAITAFLIIALVMLQDEQGEGFGGLFGGGGVANTFGASTGNVLTKATTILGVLFMASSLAVALAYKSGDTDNVIGESRRAATGGQDWFLEQPIDDAQ